MHSWQKSSGKVTKTSIKTSTDSKGASTFSLVVEYDYEVGGKKYSSINSEYGSGSQSEVLNLSGKFEKGSSIEILIDPKNPKNSAVFELSSKPSFIIYLVIGFGFAFWFFALILLSFSGILLFSNVLSFLGPLFVFFVGFAFSYVGYFLLKKDQSIKTNWKSVFGTIAASTIIQKEEKQKTDSGIYYNRTIFSPFISYRYLVESKEFFGEFSSYGTDDESEATSISSTFQKDSPIEVFFNPQNPSESTIKIKNLKVDLFPYVFLGIGIFVILMSIVLLVFGLF